MIMVTGTEASTAEVYDELVAAAQAGELDQAALETSYQRILDLKATLGG